MKRTSTQLLLICLLAFIGTTTLHAQPSFVNGSTQTINPVCQYPNILSLDNYLAINDLNSGSNETWTIVSAPSHGTLGGLSTSTTSTGSTVKPTGVTYTPSNGYSGTDVFTIQISDETTVDVTTFTVTIIPSQNTTSVQYACGSYSWNGQNYTTSGTYTFSHISSNSCTVVDTLKLFISNTTTFNYSQLACDSFYWAPKNKWYYANNNTDTVHLTNVGGCDSLVTLNLTINHSSKFTNTQFACDSFYWAAKNKWYYANNKSDTVHLTNASGCDSLVTLNLTINHSSSSTFTTSSCGSYTWALKNNKVYTSSNNTDTVHLTTVNGCDSLITLNLTILANITDVHINGVGAYCGDTAIAQLGTNINSSFGNVTYEWIRLGYNENTWQVVSTDSIVNVKDVYPAQYVVKTVITGCGTFYSNQQTVMTVKSPTVALSPSPLDTICNNNLVNFIATSADSGSNNYAFYSGNSLVQNGSVLTYNTTILTTANNGAVYTVEASNLKPTFDGNITENFWGKPLAISTGGAAPSFGAGHELNAVYARADSNYFYLAIAGNVQDQNRIMVFIDSKSGGYSNGNYGRSGLSNNSIKNFNSSNIFDPGFNADYCLGIGTDGTRSKFYFDLFTLAGTANGGGGTNNYIGSNLSPAAGYSIGASPANGSLTKGFEIAIPKTAIGYTSGDIRIFLLYSADNGFLSNQFLTRANAGSGSYGNGTVNFALATPNPIDIPVESLVSNTCKTSVSTTVTVKPNLTSTTPLFACDSAIWNGKTYTTSGTYTFNSTGSNGCDSIATLQLTIGHPSTSTTTLSACDSLVWNGTVYKTSNTYTYKTTNASGCDSVATLVLTINHPTFSDTIATACDSIVWGNKTYYTSGTYTYKTIGSTGCDSVAVLHVTINNAPSAPVITTSPGIVTVPATGVVYGCSTVSNAASYVWDYSGTGVIIITGQGTENITADFAANATIGNMEVVALSADGCVSPKTTVSVVLPVVLNNFTVEKFNDNVSIKWATSSEINSKNFEVQRSSDAKTFITTGTVAAKGIAGKYSFIDEKPLLGMNYYRLKQNDKNGKFVLSEIKALNIVSKLTVTIYPNPAKSFVNVQVDKLNGAGKIIITDMEGKKVKSQQLILGNNNVNINGISTGVYMINIITSEGRTTRKLFIE